MRGGASHGLRLRAALVVSQQPIQIDDYPAFTTPFAEEADQPVSARREPIPEPRQKCNVHHEPHEPCNPAGEAEPVHADDGTVAIHGSHAAEVSVFKGSRSAAFD